MADICRDPKLEAQPVLADGRVTPLFAHANRVSKFLFGSGGCKELSSTALYCYLSQGRRLEIEKQFSCNMRFAVRHVANKGFLGLGDQDAGLSPEDAWAKKDQLMQRYHELTQNGDKSGSIATELSTLIEKIQLLGVIEAGENWKIRAEASDSDNAWLSYSAFSQKPDWEGSVFSSASLLTKEESSSVLYESYYEKIKPFTWGIIIALLGFLFSILSVQNDRFKSLAMLSLVTLLVTDIFGITMRVLISGRAPVTNMYETVMWSGFCLFMLASIVGFRLKNRKVWAFGFFGNTICLLMMSFAPGMLDGNIQPLVPVLRDNFWLSTHVTSVTLSYSCFALSWLISNYVLISWLLRKSSQAAAANKWLEDWNYIIRIAQQVGSVFLALGIILGGIWADYSWGRFWGWDPKETWSLIALIIYMAILHGRYVGWFKGIYFTMMSGLGFMFVLMAWFGVNYILAVGLHSYGFSSGGALFLATIFIAQMMVLTIALTKKINLNPIN
jgi:cytochrome c-type biogenesis protein CcsB